MGLFRTVHGELGRFHLADSFPGAGLQGVVLTLEIEIGAGRRKRNAHDIEKLKITPIDEDTRRWVIETLSQKEEIYSLGRFATWRNILLDDVLKDLQVIKKLMNADLYSRKIHSLQVYSVSTRGCGSRAR